MHGLIREEGTFGANPSAKDLARHLYTRMWYGKIVIVADKPRSIIGSLRKQWLKLARRVQRERASTLNASRIVELAGAVSHMQGLRFTTHWLPDGHELADVYVATAEELLAWAPECRTMYVTCDVELEKLHIITAFMPKGSLVVMCRLAESSNL